jgi:hypothetical protein
MRAIQERRPGSFIVGGEQAGQPQYFPLEVIRCGDGALWSAWRPSFVESIKILFGAPIRVGILSERQPPIVVILGDI